MLHLERERRFVCDTIPSGARPSEHHVQSYLLATGPIEIRVRTTSVIGVGPDILHMDSQFARSVLGAPSSSRSELTMKVTVGRGVRLELNMKVSSGFAQLVHRRITHTVRKVRHVLDDGPLRWEFDRYEGCLDGLIVAEVELDDLATPLQRPAGVRGEVTGRREWSNRSLAATTQPPVV